MWDSFGIDSSISGPSSFTGKEIPGFGLGTIGEQGGGGSMPWGAIAGGVLNLGSALIGANSAKYGADKLRQGVDQKNQLAAVFNANSNFNQAQQQIGQNLLAAAQAFNPAGYITAPQEQFSLQKRGALFNINEIDPKKAAMARDEAIWNRDFQSSPQTIALRQQMNKEDLKKNLAEYHGKLAGMFGPIAPINTDSLVV
jgi:hypothetical protein